MADGTLFHVDILNANYYNFYYNMVAEVKEGVIQAIKSEIPDRLMTEGAMRYRNGVLAGGLRKGWGPGEFGVMGNYNINTGEIEYQLVSEMENAMVGIAATVSRNMAEEIVERAKYYCPVDKGILINSFRIEDNGDGTCTIYNDCPYAWYVEEFTWKHHDFPKQAKYLTTAVYDIQKKYGFGWA